MINPAEEQSSHLPVIPYPKGVTEKTEADVRASLQTGKPIYWTIGEVIGREEEELQRLNDKRYKQHGGLMIVTEKTDGLWYESIQLAHEIFGLGVTRDLIKDAYMIVQTNGEPENHPDYKEPFHSGDNNHTQHVLEVMKNGDSGIVTLLEEKLQEVADPKSRLHDYMPHIANGLRHGLERYQELLAHFSKNH